MVRPCRADVESEYERRAGGIILETQTKVAEVLERKILRSKQGGRGLGGKKKAKSKTMMLLLLVPSSNCISP